MVGLLETLSPLFGSIREIQDGIPSFKMFIHGLWLDASGGGTLDVDSPIDDAVAARVAREETFGPVVAVLRIKDEEEAVDISKMSRYGLDCCVFTNDYRRVWRVARDLQVGGLTVNDHPRNGVGYFPFGGSKASGIGREGIGYSGDEMTELKTIVFNLEP